MARITIEDCVKHVQNRFELVVVAAQRGKELNYGAVPCIENNVKGKRDKDAIVALREIAAGKLNIEALKNSIVRNSITEGVSRGQSEVESKDIGEMEQEIMEEIESLKEEQHSTIQKEQLYQDEEVIEE